MYRLCLTNKKGGTLLEFIIIAPIITFFVIYIVGVSIFFIKSNELKTIVNKHLETALVEGQFSDLNMLQKELESAGFETSNITINVTPNESADNDMTTYAKRGTIISISVKYSKTNIFTHKGMEVNLLGMSEKW